MTAKRHGVGTAASVTGCPEGECHSTRTSLGRLSQRHLANQRRPGLLMLPVIKYIWPLWIGLILQLATNLAGDFVFGENSAFADWVFGRNCDDIACGGKVWLSMWTIVTVLTVVNAVICGL